MTDMEVGFENASGVLIARVTGVFSLEAVLAAFQRMATEARARGAHRLLVDFASVAGDLPDLDRYDMGKRAADVFAQIERLAVVRGTHIRYTGFAVDVARNRGLDARAFLDEREALDWVLAGS